MAKCSEFTATIAQVALGIAEDVRGTNSVVAEMRKEFPQLTRFQIVDAVDRYLADAKEASVGKVKSALAQFKEEARQETRLLRAIENLQGQLETGFLQEAVPKETLRALNETIAELRKKRDAAAREQDIQRRKVAKQQALDGGAVKPAEKKQPKNTSPHLEKLREENADLNQQVQTQRKIDELIKEIERLKQGAQPTKKTPQQKAKSKALEQKQMELDLLRMKARQIIESQRKRTIGERLLDIVNLPRAVQASADISAAGLQGFLSALGNPHIFVPSFVRSLRAFGSRSVAVRAYNEILNDPLYDLFVDNGGEITPIEGGKLHTKQEEFQSHLAEKLPGGVKGATLGGTVGTAVGGLPGGMIGSIVGFIGPGRIVRASERAFATMLNSIRFKMWKQMMRLYARGSDLKKDARLLAGFVNDLSGRASLGKMGNRSAPLLNLLFYSVRNWVSRIKTMVGYQGFKALGNRDIHIAGGVAREYAKIIFGFMVTGVLLRAIGAELETDPRSSKFGTVKVGNQVIDISAQMGKEISFFSQVATGQKKSSGGDIRELVSYDFGKEDDSRDLLERKARSKASPVAGMMWDLMAHKKPYKNDEYFPVEDVPAEVIESLSPLVSRDIVKSFKNNEAGDAAVLSMLQILGFRPYEESERSKQEYIEGRKKAREDYKRRINRSR